MVPISSLAATDRMTVISTGTERVPRVVAGDASVSAAASFGFRVRCGVPLRFLRSGGGTELLDVVVASEPARRPPRRPAPARQDDAGPRVSPAGVPRAERGSRLLPARSRTNPAPEPGPATHPAGRL